MKKWTIYDKDNIAKYDVEKIEYHDIWMGEEYVLASITSPTPLNLAIGDYLMYRGRKYSIYNVPSALKQARQNTHGEAFKYDNVKFSSYITETTEIRFLDIVLGDNQLHYTSLPTFSAYCESIEDLVDRLQANTDRAAGLYGNWFFITPNKDRTCGNGSNQLGRFIEYDEEQGEWVRDEERAAVALSLWNEYFLNQPEDINTDAKTNVIISVDKNSVWDGVAMVKKHFGLNFVTDCDNGVKYVIIGANAKTTGRNFTYGKGNGLYQIERSADADQMVVTKMFAYGSDNNLPVHYYANLNAKYFAKVTGLVGHSSTPEIDVPFSSSLFTDVATYDSEAVYAVVFKFGNTQYNAYVMAEEGSSTNCLIRPRTQGQAWPTLTVGSSIEFVEGINPYKWPSDNGHTTFSDDIPNNMAVNILMLPGFPLYPLGHYPNEDPTKDIQGLCYCTYANGRTDFFLRKTTADTFSGTPFLTVDGDHRIDFSTNKLIPYLQSPNAAEIGIKEGDVHFIEDNDDNGLEDVHPSIEGMTAGDVFPSSATPDDRLDEILAVDTITDNGMFAEGATVPNFHITLKNLGFDLKQAYKDAGSMNISMKDGACGGRDFEVEGVEAGDNGTWVLNVKRCYDQALELYFPYSDAAAHGDTPSAGEPYQIKAGDHFVLTDILIQDTSYIWAASVELLRKSILWLIKNDYTRFTYLPKIDEIFMARENDAKHAVSQFSQYDLIKAGKTLQFSDSDLEVQANIYIDQLTIKEGGNQDIPTFDVVMREDKQVGSIQRMQNQINSLQGGGNGSGDSATLRYLKSLWKLDENGNLYTERNVYSLLGISALGRGTSGGGGGSVQALGDLSDVALTQSSYSEGQVLKLHYDSVNNEWKWINAADEGGMSVDAMWAALATNDNTHIINASHLPIATASALGVVKVGTTLSVDQYGLLNLPTFGTAGTYFKVTVDQYGRVSTGVASLEAADIPSLDAAKITTGTFDAARIPNIENLNHFSTKVYDASASRTANYVLAAPNGSNGAAVFRALVAADIPNLSAGKITSGTFDAARIPSLDADKITTGTFSEARIPTLAINKISGLQDALNSKLDIAFFEALFELHSGATNNPKINANSDLSGYSASEKALFNIKAMFGLWTEQFLSALGLNGQQGGGNVQALGDLSNVTLTNPQNGQVLKYNGSVWVNANDEGSSTLAWSQITGKPTTISGYGITDAYISNGTIYLGSVSITPLTSFTETDPTVPAWAKASTKPTYNLDEVLDGNTRKLADYLLKTGGTIRDTNSDFGLHITDHSLAFTYNGTTYGSITLNNGADMEFDLSSGTTLGGYAIATQDWVDTQLEDYLPLAGNDTMPMQGNILLGGYKIYGGNAELTRYIKIGDIYIGYDSSNNALEIYKLNGSSHVAANLYARGGVSALGYSAGGSGGGGATHLDDLEDVVLTNRTAGDILRYDGSNWVNVAIGTAMANYATQSQLAGYLPLSGGNMTGDITRIIASGVRTVAWLLGLEEFQNTNYVFRLRASGATYNIAAISADGIFEGAGFKTTDGSTGFLKANGTVDNSTYLTSVAFSNLTSHPTTISGYGITDAKIENGTITLGSATITPLTSSVLNDYLNKTNGGTISGDVIFNGAKFIQQYEINPSDPETAYLTIEDGVITLDSLGKIQTNNESYYFDNNGNAVLSSLTVGGYAVRHAGDTYISSGTIYIGGSSITPLTSSALNNYLPLTGGTLTGLLTISSATHGIDITNTTDARWVSVYGGLAPNLSAGNSVTIGFGKAYRNRDVGVLDFYYAGQGSVDNFVGLGFYSYNDFFRVYASGNASISGSMTASSFIKTNGTSAQFLKADGSVDTNTYALTSQLGNYLPLTAGSTNELTGHLYLHESLCMRYVDGSSYISLFNDGNVLKMTKNVGGSSASTVTIIDSSNWSSYIGTNTNHVGYADHAGEAGYATSAGTATDSTKVLKAGDTMTGNLLIAANKYLLVGGTTGSGSLTNYISAGAGFSKNSGKYGLKVLCCDQADAQTGLGQDLSTIPSGEESGYDLCIAAGNSSTDKGHISFVSHKVNSTTYRTLAQIYDNAGTVTLKVYGNVKLGNLSKNTTTAGGRAVSCWVDNDSNNGFAYFLESEMSVGNADKLDGQHGSYYAAASSLANYLPLSGGTLTVTTLPSETGVLNINSTNAEDRYSYSLMCLCSSLQQDRRNTIALGKSFTSKNSVILSYVNKGDASSTNYFSIGHHSVNDILCVTAGANVGIGTESPSCKLHVVGSIYASANISCAAQFSANSITCNGNDVRHAGNTYISNGTIYIGTNSITPVSASSLSDYLPLTAGSTKELTGHLYLHESLRIRYVDGSSYISLFNDGDVLKMTKNVGGSSASTVTIIDSSNWSSYIGTNDNHVGYADHAGEAGYATSAGTATDNTKLPLTAGSSKPLTGALYISASTGDLIDLTSATAYACMIYRPSSGYAWAVGANSSGNFYFYNTRNRSEVAYIDSLGNWNCASGSMSGDLTIAAGKHLMVGNTTGSPSAANYVSAGAGYSTGAGKYGLKVLCCDQADAQTGLGQDLAMYSSWSNAYNLCIAAGNSSTDYGYISFVSHKVNSTTYRWLGGFYDNAGTVQFRVAGNAFASALFASNVGAGVSSTSYAFEVSGQSYMSKSTATYDYPVLTVSTSQNTTWLYNCSFLAPNLSKGNNNWINIGKANSKKNSFGFTWVHAGGDGSNDNYGAVEIWDGGNRQRWYADGKSTFQCNVGIGTESPSYKLHVVGSIYASANISSNAQLSASTIKSDNYITAETTIYAGGTITSATKLRTEYSTNSNYYVELVPNFDANHNSRLNYANTLYLSGLCCIQSRLGVSTEPDTYYTVDADGQVRAGGFVNNSDARKKDIVDYSAFLNNEAIANAPAIHYYWKDNHGKGLHVGSLAQYWQNFLPEAVSEDSKGYLSMQYDVIALLAAISVAKRVTEHERRIEQLERENAMLRMEINSLKAA